MLSEEAQELGCDMFNVFCLIGCKDDKVREDFAGVDRVNVAMRVGDLYLTKAVETNSVSSLVMVGVASAVPVVVAISELVLTGNITCWY